MNYEGRISLRYLSTRKERFISAISLTAIAGVAIGVMALIVVIGVMTGFDTELRDKIIGTTAHVIVEKEVGIKDYASVEQEIRTIDGVVGATPYIQGYIFLENANQAMALSLRGIDPKTERTVTQINDYLTEGNLDDLKGDSIIIGSELARYFDYHVGDVVSLVAPSSGLSGEKWRYKLKIVGIFTSGKYDYDMSLVLVNLDKARAIYSLPQDTVTGIAVKLDDIYAAKKIKAKIYDKIGYSFLVRTWMEANQNFFRALRLEKIAMFVILTLIVLVASFNIVSTLIVTVTTKVKDIGILKSIGVPRSSIRRIFTIEGIAIGIIGVFWGLIGGISLSFLIKKYQFIQLPKDIYYVDHIPVILKLSDILIIIACALVISLLATLYPAAKAANLEPVDALRYE